MSNNLRIWVTSAFALTVGVSLTACGGKSTDDPVAPAAASSTTDTDSPTATTTATTTTTTTSTTTTSSAAALASAFPGQLALSSGFVANSGSALRLADPEIEEIDEYMSVEAKEAVLDEVLDATTAAGCFQLMRASFTQPSCFAPNIQRTTWATSPNDYSIYMPSGVTQQLYGDGGMVKATDSSGDSCTAATIKYFSEDAIQYIDYAKLVFASLVCAAKLAGEDLPAAGESTDYLAILATVPVPTGFAFTKATMAHEVVAGGSIYTTELGTSEEEGALKSYAIFRHAPSTSNDTDAKGHVVVFQAGIGDSLSQSNGGNNLPPLQLVGSSTRIAGVAVSYEIVGSVQKVQLERANFMSAEGAKHPANFITADGRLNHEAITAINASHEVADNVFTTSFMNDPTAAAHSKGIVGWTASYGDGSWRSFAYEVTTGAGGADTAKATFGFSPSYDSVGGEVTDATAPKGMYCGWAQNVGTGSGTMHLSHNIGPSGPAYDAVQYQVSVRASGGEFFVHDATNSKMDYSIQADCGVADVTYYDLAAVSAAGVVTGFTPLIASDVAFTALGGISLTPSAIDLDAE